MQNKFSFLIIMIFLCSLIFNACGGEEEMICNPGEYRCGGAAENLVQYCESTGTRWETLVNCEETERTCNNGECISPAVSDGDEELSEDGDPDIEEETEEESEPMACIDDSTCPVNSICQQDFCQFAENTRYDLYSGKTKLIYRNDLGTVNVYSAEDNRIVLKNAFASIMLDSTDDEGLFFSTANYNNRNVETIANQQKSADYHSLKITCNGNADEPVMIWNINSNPEKGYYTFNVEVQNTKGKEIKVAKITPLKTSSENNGGLYLGAEPAHHRIWENGSYSYFDFFANIVPGDVKQDGALALVVPGNFEGNSVSNLNHAVVDLDSSIVWIAGALTFEKSSPVVNISYNENKSTTDSMGRKSFNYFALEAAYNPHPKRVAANESLLSETYYINSSEDNVFDGLENWALTVKETNNIVLWQERNENNRIPNGWNSWTTSGSTGGYGTGINEQIILDNLEVMADEFRDWGIDWFQIDDGYEPTYGDWWWDSDKFPNGPAWLTQKIRDKGLKPGLWMAPFTLYEDSQTYINNPEWIAGLSDVGLFFHGNYKIFDLTNPDVQDHLKTLFTTFKNDWGFDWLKMDFSYYALFGDDFYDSNKTREEAYRKGIRIIRDTIGDDTFFLGVSALGPHMGIIDADRLTLDNMPVWDKQPDDSETGKGTQQGFKPTVRCASRRYYLHNRVWINHSDLIVFRSNTRDESWPRVTYNETQTFCSYVGLSGGIVKMGDKLVDLKPKEINTVRKLLPIYNKGARPLDILEREFAEQWHLHVDKTNDGYDEEYEVIGLFNWGENWDMTVNPYRKIEDEGQTLTFNLDKKRFDLDMEAEYLAYEFWSNTFLGKYAPEDEMIFDVLTRTSNVIALRKVTGVPQFLGWNRQITMGGTDLEQATYDSETNSMTIKTKVAKASEFAPFTYRISVYMPSGYTFDKAEYTGSPVKNEATEVKSEGKQLELSFDPDETGEIEIVISFT